MENYVEKIIAATEAKASQYPLRMQIPEFA